jgi:hypothetical protein
MFALLGPVGGIARLLLPLRAYISNTGNFTLGAKQLSRATLDSTLAKVSLINTPV